MQEHISLAFYRVILVGYLFFMLSGFRLISSHLISRVFISFSTECSFFQDFIMWMWLCECVRVIRKENLTHTYEYTLNKVAPTHKHTIHQMLIHYNTKILILWRHTSIQWKFIWQHFWTLKSMVALSWFPFSRYLLCFFAFNEREFFISFRSHVPESELRAIRMRCHGDCVCLCLSVHASINVFEICFDRRKRKHERFVFNVTSCISPHVAMQRIQNANANTTEGISMILQIIL